MIRWTTMLLFASCLMRAGPWTQAAPGQATPKQSAPGQVGEAASAKSGFPLDEFTEFSAVMVGSMQPHDDREGYVYRSGNLLRSEGPMEKGYYMT
jgi:hypothetical protein